MSVATVQMGQVQAFSLASSTAFRDVWDGACAAARWVVTVSGIAAIGLGALLLGQDDLRASVASAWPSASIAPVAISEPVEVAEEPAPVRPSTSVDPRQKHVAQYLARRYRVADGAVRMLVSAAFDIGREKNLDPLLILSVIAIESSLNPFAESPVGAQGLMQVMTRVHSERFVAHGGEMAALDPIANMKVGSEILRDVIARGGSIERGLQLYVGAGNLPDDGGYGARVLGERARLQLASTGKVEAAIAAGRTPSAPAPESKPATAEVVVPPIAVPQGEATT